MKAVILAGGLGTRMREETEFRPKPMVEIGGRPILWHLMKSFASQGVSEFILLVGYRGEQIKRYFLNYGAMEASFTLSLEPGAVPTYLGEDPSPGWKVTVLDTGDKTLTGGRLKQAQQLLQGETFFLTYGDGLSDVPVMEVLSLHKKLGSSLTLSSARLRSRFGALALDEEGRVRSFAEKPLTADYVNIGFMVADSSVLSFIQGDEPFEGGPLERLVRSGEVGAYRHDGFFAPMDTMRDVDYLNALWEEGEAPWKIW